MKYDSTSFPNFTSSVSCISSAGQACSVPRGSSGTGGCHSLSQTSQPVWRCPQGAALQPARPPRPPAKEFNGFGGVNTCHQPFLTLHNYWAELCFLQPAQRVPLPPCLTVPAGAASTCLWSWRGTGAAEPQGTRNFCLKPQISAPSPKSRPCSQTEGRSGELLHWLHCSHPFEGHLQEGSSGCCLRRLGPLSTTGAGGSFLLRLLPKHSLTGPASSSLPQQTQVTLEVKG